MNGRAKEISQPDCPVCGAPIADFGSAPRVNYGGEVWVFSSNECLARFEAEPERYSRELEDPEAGE